MHPLELGEDPSIGDLGDTGCGGEAGMEMGHHMEDTDRWRGRIKMTTVNLFIYLFI